MRLIETFAETREAISGSSAALVPTMGFLHDGHISLVELARRSAATVVMSLFVNPLQFNEAADLERYPRDLTRDSEIAAASGVDVLFSPSADEMYSITPSTRIHVAGVADDMEGAHRPGHFEGVATVVAKLFAGVQPDVAVFGRKDAQQLAVVRRMTVDLSFPVGIVGAPTVREADGLAVASRNVFLSADDRAAALGLSSGLFAAAEAVAAGERVARRLESIVENHVATTGGVVEYVTLVEAQEAEPMDILEREAFLAIAARVGDVRLIDNVFLWPDGSADTGVRLDGPSMLGRV